jgi:hypothetical protein
MIRLRDRLLPATKSLNCAHAVALAAFFGVVVLVCSTSHATVIVSDTWNDSTRTDPAAPVYSEYGVDSDSDGNIESAWYVNSPNLTVAPGHMTLTQPTGSQNATTYFTPAATPITLANSGDFVQVTWVFTPSGVVTGNTSQAFNFCVVDTPSAARLSSDAAPGTAAYAGYAMYTNMSTTLGNAHPFQLKERSAASSTLLNTGGDWTAVADGATTGTTGYASGTKYTMTWTMTRGSSNDLVIDVKMQGGSINNSGTADANFDDTTPNTFTYDTFNVRPSGSASAATSFDYNSFTVVTNVPEPGSLILMGLGAGVLGMSVLRRKNTV